MTSQAQHGTTAPYEQLITGSEVPEALPEGWRDEYLAATSIGVDTNGSHTTDTSERGARRGVT